MAFNDDKNFETVTALDGTPVMAAEINEAQQISAVRTAEGLAAAVGTVRAADDTSMSFLSAEVDGWRPRAATVAGPTIVVEKGVAYVDGYRVTLPADVDLAVEGLLFPVVGGADVYGWIVVDFVMVEVGSTLEPTIATGLGETSTRKQLQYTFNQGESTTFELAWTALPALSGPVSPPGRLHKGDVARVALCRYLRPAASTNITAAMVLDVRAPSQGERHTRQKFVKTLRQANTGTFEGTGTADGMVVWNSSTSRLLVGIANGQADVDSIQNGIMVRSPGSPNHHANNTTGVIWAASGTPVIPDATKGYLIAEGEALGYLTPVDGATAARTEFVGKAEIDPATRTNLHDYAPAPSGYTPDALLTQNLVVETLDTFSGDPNAFILCHRVGADLVWYNGQVTRGAGAVNVLVELGDHPSPYSAIVGASGSNHMTQSDAVERALAFLSSGVGAAALGVGTSRRVHVRRGAYVFARGVKRYGTVAEGGTLFGYDANTTTFELTGDGPECTSVQFSNPASAGRADADIGVCAITAARVVIRGINFSQLNDATYGASYLLNISAIHVILEDCTFTGPLYVKANHVSIRRCTFIAQNNSSHVLFPSAIVGAALTAAHLYLTPYDTSVLSCRWDVSHCLFTLYQSLGSNAGVIVQTTGTVGLVATLGDNEYVYGNSTAQVPAIHIDGDKGQVSIRDSRFTGSYGVIKAGSDTSLGDVVPFDGDYKGSVLQGSISGGTISKLTACAYISVTTSRGRSSMTNIERNFFDMKDVSASNSGRFCVWGACMVVMNYVTNGNAAEANVCNVRYCDNVVNAYLSGSGQWTAAGAASQPAIHGFYLAPLWQDGRLLTNVMIDGITVTGNKFYTGGFNGQNALKAWRTILAPSLDAWPVADGFLTDAAAPISIVLRNAVATAITYAGRSGRNIVVADNYVGQQDKSGTAVALIDQITLDDSVHPMYGFYAIRLDGGDYYTTSAISPTEGAGPTYYLGSAALFTGLQVHNNVVHCPMYVRGAGMTDNPAGIFIHGAFGANVNGNTVYLSGTLVAGDGIDGMWVNGKQNNINGNTVTAGTGFRCNTGTAYVSGNLFRACSAASSVLAGGLATFNTGSNFT